MAKKRAGWERKVYYGTAGAAAATQITRAIDVDVANSPAFDDTTTRGDGSSVPKQTEQVVGLAAGVSFGYRYYDGDATMAALLAAARAGTGVAIKVERIASGETEFDGDCYLEFNSPGPLTGGMVVEFTCHPTDDYGRDWSTG